MIKEIFGSKIEVIWKDATNGAHYEMTPYSYTPRTGLKLSPNLYTDLGQGLIECVEEIEKSRD